MDPSRGFGNPQQNVTAVPFVSVQRPSTDLARPPVGDHDISRSVTGQSQQSRPRSPGRQSPAPQNRLNGNSSIRLRRLTSQDNLRVVGNNENGRRRSPSDPQRNRDLNLPGNEMRRQRTGTLQMPIVEEGVPTDTGTYLQPVATQPPGANGETLQPPPPRSTSRRLSNAARSALGRQRTSNPPSASDAQEQEYQSHAVDLLDVVDPEVSTLTTLTNVQNSLFVPNLGRFLNRRPTYDITPRYSEESTDSSSSSDDGDTLPRVSTVATDHKPEDVQAATEGGLTVESSSQQRRRFSISSQLDDEHYAVLPHLFSVDEWEEKDVKALNEHVRHQLHSRRARFKRTLGFFVTLYATLITIFGLVWVLFLIGWISAGERQPYITNIVDNVLVALFAVVGDGLAPFRAVDTYHMCFIAHYHHLTWRLRRERGVEPLPNENDLPEKIVFPELPNGSTALDVDTSVAEDKKPNDIDDGEDIEPAYPPNKFQVSMLTPVQQRKLEHHQQKFAASHSFYKPHESITHHAFPLRFLVAAVVLLDMHSIFQIMLGSFTWGWTYHTRPSWITAVILSLSITVNITGGIVISIGGKRTRKKEVIETMFRQNLTEEGIRKLRKKRRKEQRQSLRDRVQDVAIGWSV
ncbi:uncharacterized protein KY384_000534 [Bacidia gigantensis]|uniref:uncharacterized protein n=1 Tax=Bacidia gigantensis TaxID=2732470 RepID=UPI001D0377DD|nr:uncharacterized protein KY384_000534 [Bacidia gigantensis]KAG8525774.1 hypothetical protein KY384_000534 [Bacidia gigantensis]